MLLFIKYFGVGIINTIVHWGIFYILLYFGNLQSVSNLIGFIFGVSCSYILNSIFTFKQALAGRKFLYFSCFMGGMSFIVGHVADLLDLPSLFTLVFFSAFSLVIGFLFSKYFVFRV